MAGGAVKNEQRIVEWKLSPQEIEEFEAEIAKILEDMRTERIAAIPPSPLIGAHRFHKWVERQLPPEVREHYGGHFVFATHPLLADGPDFPWARKQAKDKGIMYLSMSVFQRGNTAKPEPTGLACPGCPCKSKGELADCLIGRFHRAYKSITSKSIEEWYFDLSGQAEKDVRALLRVAASSDPLIRKAIEQILSREESPAVVTVRGKSGNLSVALRDAFMYTAMVAVREWPGIELADEPAVETVEDCAARVARVFGIKTQTVRNRWKSIRTRAAVGTDLETPGHRGRELREFRRIGIEVIENHAVRAATLERLKNQSRANRRR